MLVKNPYLPGMLDLFVSIKEAKMKEATNVSLLVLHR